MDWRVEFDPDALRELRQLDRQVQRRVLGYLKERVLAREDPRQLGKALKGGLHGLWRYRVGDYRIVCAIQQEVPRILVLRLAHRSEAYDRASTE